MGGSAIAGWRRRKRRVDGTLSAHRTREERGDLRDVLENRIGYSSHDAATGVAWLMQSDVVPPGAELVYYEHPDLTYPDPRGGFCWFMSQRWRSTAQIDYARGAAAARSSTCSAAAQH